MRLKWYFCNNITPIFSEVAAFRPKATWNPPKGHHNLEVFLSEVKKELVSYTDSKSGYFNLSSKEWKAMRSLAVDSSIVNKKEEEGSSVVVSDRKDFVTEHEKRLSDSNVYKDVAFAVMMTHDLLEQTTNFSKTLNQNEKLIRSS